ncbi:short chain dehydrogenase [Seiridium cupressi]
MVVAAVVPLSFNNLLSQLPCRAPGRQGEPAQCRRERDCQISLLRGPSPAALTVETASKASRRLEINNATGESVAEMALDVLMPRLGEHLERTSPFPPSFSYLLLWKRITVVSTLSIILSAHHDSRVRDIYCCSLDLSSLKTLPLKNKPRNNWQNFDILRTDEPYMRKKLPVTMSAIAPKVAQKVPSVSRTTSRRAVSLTPARAIAFQRPVLVSSKASPPALQTFRKFHSTPRNHDREPISNSPRALLPEFSLKDRVIVVSGGAQGLGLVQTEALLEAGATVHVFDRQPQPGPGSKYERVAKRATGELETTLTYHQIDVRTGVNEINKITEQIAEQHGHIDGLIAAAGIQQETPALDYTAEDADRMLGVNVTGVLMTAQAVARQMVKRKTEGSLVLIASMSGTIANRGLICPVYNASKAAVIQLGRNLASEWGEHGIRVNTISPGYIVTEMVAKLFERYPEREKEWPTHNMLNKLSKPEDYRGAAVFLLSEASRFMTGADLRIDGGHAAW